MKINFRLRLLLFLLPVLSGVVGIAFAPVDPYYPYAYLGDDCMGRAPWVYQRLSQDTSTCEVAFIGSSHTLNGVNDSLLSALTGRPVANFGYCRLGRNLQWVLANRILQTKKPRVLVIEVKETEDQLSHPLFPYLASSKEVFFPAWQWNVRLFSDAAQAFTWRLEYCQKRVQGVTLPQTAGDIRQFGYLNSDHTAPLADLEKAAKRRHKTIAPASDWQAATTLAFPLHYLEKMALLCEEQQVRVVYLYLPSYGCDPEMGIEGKAWYEAHGELWIPPATILTDPAHWGDDNHLNAQGAEKLTRWLAGQFER